MKVLVIGGTGHIGSYLVPRLVQAGHEVQVIARKPAPQYGDSRVGWPAVTWVICDRTAEEQDERWAQRLSQLQADVVVDLICYDLAQHRLVVEGFAGRVRHLLHCGTIWSYGPPRQLPYEEHHPRHPISDYGRKKAAIEAELLDLYRTHGLPATIIHPGHICGRGWLPIDPQGGRSGVAIYRQLAQGEAVVLPDAGQATLHHVHADDVAQLFELAIRQPHAAMNQSFSAVAPYAMTLLGCCETVAGFFGAKPNIQFVPFDDLEHVLSPEDYSAIAGHVRHSPCCSIEKGRRLLDYEPRYTTAQIYRECVEHLLATGELCVES